MAIPTPVIVKDAAGTDVSINAPLSPGRASAAESRPVALSTEDLAKLTAVVSGLGDILAKLSATPATAAGQSSGNTSLASIDGKIPALGQAVAGSSAPVVLPAAQIAALTPPAAISGFATVSGQTAGNASLASIDAKLTGPVPVAQQPIAVVAVNLLSGVTAATTGSAIDDLGRPPSFSASLSGSGQLSATVLIEARPGTSGAWIPYGGFNLAGSGGASALLSGKSARLLQYRGKCTDITAGGTLTVTMTA